MDRGVRSASPPAKCERSICERSMSRAAHPPSVCWKLPPASMSANPSSLNSCSYAVLGARAKPNTKYPLEIESGRFHTVAFHHADLPSNETHRLYIRVAEQSLNQQ